MTTPNSELLETANNAFNSGDFYLSEALYREFLATSPSSLEAMLKLSHLYMQDGRNKLAIPLLSKAINLDPTNPYSYYNLGLAYQQSEDSHLAVQYYKAALAIKPGFPLALNNLGVTLQHIGDIELANRYFTQAFSWDTDCFEAYFNYAQSHKFAAKDFDLLKMLEQKLDCDTIEDEKKNSLVLYLGQSL